MTPVKDIRVEVVLKITIDTKSLHLLIKGGVKADVLKVRPNEMLTR